MDTMAGLDIAGLQDEILEYIESLAPTGYRVIESDLADAVTVVEEGGVRQPMWVVQFSDLFPTSGDGSFFGPTNDGYYSIFRVYSIAASPSTVRKANSLINQVLLGKKFDNSGAISKQWGGGQFALGEANSRPIAYVLPAAFRFATNVEDPGDTIFP